ncbi:hypothetical protein K438DRAFT_1769865 [Mycena galopus ATCC 62051]|nr:hypothetical protein K438DRAFT_1769865 [Mycena galopus ATCC 62051]
MGPTDGSAKMQTQAEMGQRGRGGGGVKTQTTGARRGRRRVASPREERPPSRSPPPGHSPPFFISARIHIGTAEGKERRNREKVRELSRRGVEMEVEMRASEGPRKPGSDMVRCVVFDVHARGTYEDTTSLLALTPPPPFLFSSSLETPEFYLSLCGGVPPSSSVSPRPTSVSFILPRLLRTPLRATIRGLVPRCRALREAKLLVPVGRSSVQTAGDDNVSSGPFAFRGRLLCRISRMGRKRTECKRAAICDLRDQKCGLSLYFLMATACGVGVDIATSSQAQLRAIWYRAGVLCPLLFSPNPTSFVASGCESATQGELIVVSQRTHKSYFASGRVPYIHDGDSPMREFFAEYALHFLEDEWRHNSCLLRIPWWF